MVSLARLQAASDGGDPAGECEHNVLAEVGEILLLPAAESFSQPHQEQQRSDAPCDPEHGQEGAQLVRPQGRQRLPDRVDHDSHVAFGRPRPRIRLRRGSPSLPCRLWVYTSVRCRWFHKLLCQLLLGPASKTFAPTGPRVLTRHGRPRLTVRPKTLTLRLNEVSDETT